MKKLMLIAALAALAGCQTAYLENEGNGKWKAKVSSHMFSRQFKGFTAEKKSGGEFSFSLDGYRGDTSEQLPVFTEKSLFGLALLARIAAAAYNPAASGVPLDASAANAEEVSKLVKAVGEAKAELVAVKAELAKASSSAAAQTAAAQGSSACANGECEAK